jgi:hypothetical protein
VIFGFILLFKAARQNLAKENRSKCRLYPARKKT